MNDNGAQLPNPDGSGSTLVVTPSSQTTAAQAYLANMVNAIAANTAMHGTPFLNMLKDGYINQINANTHLRDGTRPTDLYFITVMGPLAGRFAMLHN